MHRLTLLLLFAATPGVAAEDEGWVAMFNGRDLSNWVNVNCAPETWTVKDGVIACTGKPTGALRTPEMYENFVWELEWRHLRPGGNAGIFVWSSPIAAPGVPFLRAIEVQVLDNGFDVPGKNQWYTTHGDVFPIHGSTMKPIHRGSGSRCFPLEELSKSSPEWNHYRITGQDGKLRLSVNGKEVSGGDQCVWRKGYLGLESEGSPTEWRNIRIKKLPSIGDNANGATAAETAPEDQGWRTLYNGLDLRGWKVDDELRKQWTAGDWQLKHGGGKGVLRTEAMLGDCEVVVDCQPPKAVAEPAGGPALVLGDLRIPLSGKPGVWTRYVISIRGKDVSIQRPDGSHERVALPADAAPRRLIGLSGAASGATGFANIYIRQGEP